MTCVRARHLFNPGASGEPILYQSVERDPLVVSPPWRCVSGCFSLSQPPTSLLSSPAASALHAIDDNGMEM